MIGELVNGSAASVAACSELLNQSDVAIIQHEYGLYGGVDGDDVVDIVDGLRVPSIVIAHTILKDPTPHQRSVLEAIAAMADQVVVMSEAARHRLCLGFDVDRRKVTTIPHGATVPSGPALKRPSRPTILTWGLLGPGKGVERVIEAMGSLSRSARPAEVPCRRPDAPEGSGRRRRGISRCPNGTSASQRGSGFGVLRRPLLEHVIAACPRPVRAVVVLPYDSTDQVTSGVLVDAIACGRPVVATAFPHAIELLGTGAGIVVTTTTQTPWRPPCAGVLTQPRLAGSMAAEARRMAPEMAWPVVASAYLRLADRLLTERRALV